jgi:hypothetical protein
VPPSFASDTPIGVPDGMTPIAELSTGDQVLTGSPSGVGVSWAPEPLQFSEGATGGSESAMLYLTYGDEERGLITSPDQPFMLATGELSTAERLVPGDELMGQDGNPTPLVTASIGRYDGGVHAIAADTSWTGSLDGHLIVANGLVAGDYTLGLHFQTMSADSKSQDDESRPSIE